MPTIRPPSGEGREMGAISPVSRSWRLNTGPASHRPVQRGRSPAAGWGRRLHSQAARVDLPLPGRPVMK